MRPSLGHTTLFPLRSHRDAFFLWYMSCEMRIVEGPSCLPVKSQHIDANFLLHDLRLTLTYSNFSAAIELGKPETKMAISQGRSFSREVRTAPPLASPLCCLSRLGGFGVDPTYIDACLTVERRT